MAAAARPVELAIVGAGPTAASLLERISASAGEILGGRLLRVHLVDPHRAGTGRVWRPDLHPLLWMNSMAEDVTMFLDESVQCAGPVRPGPSLHEWAMSVDDTTLREMAAPELVTEIRGLTGMSFPTRLVQSVYLDWFHRHVMSTLPPNVEVLVHEQRVLDVLDAPDGSQEVILDGEVDPLRVDVVVLSLGHLDADPDEVGAALVRFATNHGLVYLPPGHTAEQDLSVLAPGTDVLALGFGQAFTDLLVLVTEGRGGRFVGSGDDLRYEPSGLEPVIHVGSRRGVPYRSKLDYRLHGPPAPLPRFLDDAAIERLLACDGQLEFRRDVLPLVAKEVGWAYYHELFAAHSERTTATWEDFASRYAEADPEQIAALVADTVPDPSDRFDIDALDRPLRGLTFGSADDLHRHVVDHVRADIRRRTDPAYSADLGAFHALLQTFGALPRIGASGRLTPRSRVVELGAWWFSFFMYYASGPPPQRLRQLLALADAGLVRFLGAGAIVLADPERGRFVARSTSHVDEVVAGALVDARIATASVRRSTEPLLRSLAARGEVVEEVVSDDSGWCVNTGKVCVVGPDLRVLGRDGTGHARRHALGIFTNRPAAGALARPRMNAPAFRQNDLVARSILSTLAAIPADDLSPVGRAAAS
jgi:uncharacterized NAD(P)/FAD-binding protein YdhS